MPDNDITTDPTTGQPTTAAPTNTIPVVPIVKPVAHPIKKMTAKEYLAQEMNSTPTPQPAPVNVPQNNAVVPTPTVQPNTPPVNTPTARLNQQQLDAKYKDNPYLVGGRDKWADKLNTSFNFSGTNVKQSYYNAAKSTGVDPSLLYASSSEEGVQGLFPDKNGMVPFTEDKDHPVDGYVGFGLDNIGTQIPSLIKKGLLPANFINKVKTATTKNEKGQQVTSSNFTDEDAGVMASAAVLKNSRNNLDAYTKANNISLTPRQEDFFNLAAFNLGDAGTQKMLQSYKEKGYLNNDNFLDDPNFKPASYGGVYTHVQRRLVPRQYMNDHGVFSDYKPINQPQQVYQPQQQPVAQQAPTTQQKPTGLNNQNRNDWNSFQDSGETNLADYIKNNPKTSLTLQMAGALQQDLNNHKGHLQNLVNTGQAIYANGVDHSNMTKQKHKFSTAYMATQK